jgi:purine-cytosine permease-like protein
MSKQLTHHGTELDPRDPADIEDRLFEVEKFGVDHIPDEERKSRPINLFFILHGSCITFSLFVLGWFPLAFGLSWWASFSAVAVGSFIGALFLAPMGLFGPRTGTNNPVTSGGHFGIVGRLIGTFLEASYSLAFAALSIWTGGDALVSVLKAFVGVGDSTMLRVVCYGVLSIIITTISIVGHDLMLKVQRFMIPTAGLFTIIGIFVFAGDFKPGYHGTGSYLLGSFWPTWITSMLIVLSTVNSYGSYAGDWSRHISRRFSDRSILTNMFLGGFLGMGLPILWGAYTAAATFASGTGTPDKSYVFALADLSPKWYLPLLLYLGLASGTAQAVINTYGTGLDTSSFIPKLTRIQATFAACALATALVYLGYFYSGIVDAVSTSLNLLVDFSVPWIVVMAIGLVHRRGFYLHDDLQVFNRGEKGGRYWFTHGLNWRATGPWLLSAAVGIFLFSNTAWYTSPGADLLGGTDIGFAVAAVLTGVLYPIMLKLFPEPRFVFRDYYDEDPNEVLHRERRARRDGATVTAPAIRNGESATLEPVPTEGAR